MQSNVGPCRRTRASAGNARAFRVARAGLLLALTACRPAGASDGFDELPRVELDAEVVWAVPVPDGGNSSPRAVDVDGDGVRDVTFGCGTESVRGAVVVLDGADGSTRWSRAYGDDVYASACPLDVNADGVPDLVYGRRKLAGGVAALCGSTGRRLWSLRRANPGEDFPPLHWNSLTPCWDVDGDGVRDLVALQGGGADWARPPGRIYLLSGRTGAVLGAAETPDARESYSVPAVVSPATPGGEGWLVIGTGGETEPGHLFRLDVPSFAERWRVPSDTKGFVPGVVLHDFDGDGLDVVAAAFDATVLRLDGETGRTIWRLAWPGCESYVTPAVGRFDPDLVLDVVTVFSEGVWPAYETRADVVWIDGSDGSVLARRGAGVMASASPLVADLNGDGYDEAVIVTNDDGPMRRFETTSRLLVFDGRRAKACLLSRAFEGFSASTPWLGDLDGDGATDVLFVHATGAARLRLVHPGRASVRWNQYRGPGLDGLAAR